MAMSTNGILLTGGQGSTTPSGLAALRPTKYHGLKWVNLPGTFVIPALGKQSQEVEVFKGSFGYEIFSQ